MSHRTDNNTLRVILGNDAAIAAARQNRINPGRTAPSSASWCGRRPPTGAGTRPRSRVSSCTPSSWSMISRNMHRPAAGVTPAGRAWNRNHKQGRRLCRRVRCLPHPGQGPGPGVHPPGSVTL